MGLLDKLRGELIDIVEWMDDTRPAASTSVILAIVLGIVLRWSWVRNLWFRATHLAAILLVCLESIFGITCPFTTWENQLRSKAGQASYTGDFIGHWLHELIFFEARSWVFTACYITFGMAVALVFLIAPPRWPRRGPE